MFPSAVGEGLAPPARGNVKTQKMYGDFAKNCDFAVHWFFWLCCAAGRGLPLPLRWIMHVHDLTHSLFIICIFRQIVKSAQAFD